MTKRPSDTRQGKLWIGNFAPDERQAAELLINSLRIISETSFRASMVDLLTRLVVERDRPIAIYPIRALPRDLGEQNSIENQAEPGNENTTKPGPFPPLDHPFQPLPGSEGIVANIVRDVIGKRPTDAVASAPMTLEELRRIRVRSIMLVDDYSGTGDRVIKFIDAWMRNRTIRSWYSYKLIRFDVVLIAISGQALARLRRHPRIADIHFLEQAADFNTARWTNEEAQAIQALCLKYAYVKNFELGYQNSQGLFVFQHTVPNNLPSVLWQDKCSRVPNWMPFFGGRKMTSDLQRDLDNYRLEIDARKIAALLKQNRLSDSIELQQDPTVRLLLLVLAAAARKIRDPQRLSVALGTTMASAVQTRLACQDLSLLDSKGRLTDQGRAELRRARTRIRITLPKRNLIGSEELYYPSQLRGVNDI